MKKVTLALVAVTLSLSACTRVVEVEVAASDPPETTTAKPATTPAPAPVRSSSNDRYSLRGLFLDTLYGINPDLEGFGMDADFFDGALGTCEALDSGMTIDDVVGMAAESAGLDEDLQMMFASVLATTITVVCPEYEYMMPK